MIETHLQEILALPASERLRLIDLIWESLTPEADQLPLSEAHIRAIDEAVAEHEANPDDTISRDELFDMIRRDG